MSKDPETGRESRRGFLSRVFGRRKTPGDGVVDDSRDTPTADGPSTDRDANTPTRAAVMAALERGEVEGKLDDETIRELTAEHRRARRDDTDQTHAWGRPAFDDADAAPAAPGHDASWRPETHDPFADGTPTVRAVELHEELQAEERRLAESESVFESPVSDRARQPTISRDGDTNRT